MIYAFIREVDPDRRETLAAIERRKVHEERREYCKRSVHLEGFLNSRGIPDLVYACDAENRTDFFCTYYVGRVGV